MTECTQHLPCPEPKPALTQQARSSLKGIWVTWKNWAWWISLPVVLILAIAIKYQVTINMTPSLPITWAVIERGNLTLKHGDLVAFRWTGQGPIPQGLELIKRVTGMPGDTVHRNTNCQAATDQADLYSMCMDVRTSSGQLLGSFPVKKYTRQGAPLQAGAFEGVIPAEFVFVSGDHPDSLDSRYALTGLIGSSQMLGRSVWAH